jgi:hypothetical protein
VIVPIVVSTVTFRCDGTIVHHMTSTFPEAGEMNSRGKFAISTWHFRNMAQGSTIPQISANASQF